MCMGAVQVQKQYVCTPGMLPPLMTDKCISLVLTNTATPWPTSLAAAPPDSPEPNVLVWPYAVAARQLLHCCPRPRLLRPWCGEELGSTPWWRASCRLSRPRTRTCACTPQVGGKAVETGLPSGHTVVAFGEKLMNGYRPLSKLSVTLDSS